MPHCSLRNLRINRFQQNINPKIPSRWGTIPHPFGKGRTGSRNTIDRNSNPGRGVSSPRRPWGNKTTPGRLP